MKRILAAALCLMLLLTGCGGSTRQKEIAEGLAAGNYHVLVPENEAASHEDGTFEDYDTYCVFQLPEGMTVLIDEDRPEAKGYEWYANDHFLLADGEAFLDRWQYVLDGETYYLDVYRFLREKGGGEWVYAGDTLIAGKEVPDRNEGWMYAGLAESEIPAAISGDLLNFDAAPSEQLGGLTVYTFADIAISDLAQYGDWLQREGWMYNTDIYDNPTDMGRRYIEGFRSEDEYMLIAAYADKVKVFRSKEWIRLAEEEIWDILGAPARPGERYMRENCPSFPLQVGTGNGSTGDLVYNFNENAKAADFDSMRDKLLADGFTEDVQEYEKDGQRVFTAWSHRSYCGFDFRLYTKLIMEGSWLEVQVGTHADAGIHRDR